MSLLIVNENGLYCKQGDFYIDPWRPVKEALITHAHADHMRWGSQHYITHKDSVPILHHRLGKQYVSDGVEYRSSFELNGVKISFHPAGHIIGSSQIRLEYNDQVWVCTGDYKLANDGVSQPYEAVPCDHLITESTFGLPIYQFPCFEQVYNEINNWWRENALQGYNTILLSYALGKAQNILAHLDKNIGDIYLHGAVVNTNTALEVSGYTFPGRRLDNSVNRANIRGAAIVAPPSALHTPWMQKLKPYRVAMCSGWMQLRGSRRRRNVDKGFVLSDHCDWNQLQNAIKLMNPKQVYVTHGYEAAFARWVNEKYNIPAHIYKTLYNDEEEDAL